MFASVGNGYVNSLEQKSEEKRKMLRKDGKDVGNP